MKKILLSCLLMVVLTLPAFAMGQGGYGVDCNINYYNPDTHAIEDAGSANAALGEGMCRSATHTSALVEFDGTDYYVTIRLLLQSNTKDVMFWRHTGYDTYEEVSYEIVMEDAGTDAVDYRFQVADPFAPIKASMYVTPMGRATVWFIELDETSLSADTGDFVVSVSNVVVEDSPVGDGNLDVPTPAVDEPIEDAVGTGLDQSAPEEEPIVDEPIEEEPTVEESADELVGNGLDHSAPEEEPTVDELVVGEPQQSTNYTPYILATMLAVIAGVIVAVKKGNKP